jgi:hypothetical protein
MSATSLQQNADRQEETRFFIKSAALSAQISHTPALLSQKRRYFPQTLASLSSFRVRQKSSSQE